MIGEDFHKCVYGKVSNNVTSEFSEEDKHLLNSRITSDFENICNYHKIKFLLKYNHLYGKVCLDPLRYHKKAANIGLRETTLVPLSKKTNCYVNLIPGKSLCPTCNKKIFNGNQDEYLLRPRTKLYISCC